MFRLRGQGHTLSCAARGRGDQYVTVNVVVPKNMTAAQKDALREYAKAMDGRAPESSSIFGRKKK